VKNEKSVSRIGLCGCVGLFGVRKYIERATNKKKEFLGWRKEAQTGRDDAACLFCVFFPVPFSFIRFHSLHVTLREGEERERERKTLPSKKRTQVDG